VGEIMKKLIFSVITTTILSIAPVFAAPDLRDFDINNDTGYTITHIYINDDASETAWTEDILGKDTTLEDGNYIPIDFNGHQSEDCKFDLKVTFENNDDDTWILKNVNLCKVGTVTLEWNGKTVLYKKALERME
jgi:hypothetical protein